MSGFVVNGKALRVIDDWNLKRNTNWNVDKPPKDSKLKTVEKYEIYKHYKQSLTNILNDELRYKSLSLFDEIRHLCFSHHCNPSLSVPLGPPSIDNGAHGTGKFLLKIEVSEDFA